VPARSAGNSGRPALEAQAQPQASGAGLARRGVDRVARRQCENRRGVSGEGCRVVRARSRCGLGGRRELSAFAHACATRSRSIGSETHAEVDARVTFRDGAVAAAIVPRCPERELMTHASAVQPLARPVLCRAAKCQANGGRGHHQEQADCVLTPGRNLAQRPYIMIRERGVGTEQHQASC